MDGPEAGVYLYTHWGGSELPQILASAMLRGKDRWDDESYLARIIFSEMVQGAEMETTGYGIATYEMDKNHETIFVDVANQEIRHGQLKYTFTEFVEAASKEARRKAKAWEHLVISNSGIN